MEEGPPMFRQNFTCSALLKSLIYHHRIRGYHPLWRWFPTASSYYDPATGLVRVRSPLLPESRLMSFPLGTEMFQFPRFALFTYVFSE